MGTADNIRSHRIRAGQSAQKVAAALGLNDAWYADLESKDDELASTLTLFQATHLASLLKVRLRDLVAGVIPVEERVSLVDVPPLIEKHIAVQGLSIEEFENEVGWELQEFMQSPVRVAAELPLMFLMDLSEAVGIDWLSLVPDEPTP
jgi:transcriptional regulator with XRE-family HTH domain